MGHKAFSPMICLLLCICLAISTCTVAVEARQLGEKDQGPTIEEYLDSNLTIPAGNSLREVLFAVGVQIYSYDDNDWGSAVNASADLYDGKGRRIGHHYYLTEADANGGHPTWETYNPASRVTVKRVAAVEQENSIDWLLTEATSTSGSKKQLGKVTYVQRLYTQGGKPPAAGSPAKEGDVYESPYTALYTYAVAS